MLALTSSKKLPSMYAVLIPKFEEKAPAAKTEAHNFLSLIVTNPTI